MTAQMVRREGGRFRMGSDEFYADQQPVHDRTFEPFVIDMYKVTNKAFACFVAETCCVTVAERPLNLHDFPGADPRDMLPGSMVFTPTVGPTDLTDWRNWWRWVPGASWRAPFGVGSNIDDRLDHPVVHVTYEDACAFAVWAGKRLPIEAEHEFAANTGISHVGFRCARDA